MANAEDFIGEFGKPRAERDIEFFEYEFAKRIATLSLGHEDGGHHRRMKLRIPADDIKPPMCNRSAYRFAIAFMTREHIVEPLLVKHVYGFIQAIEERSRGRIREETGFVLRLHIIPGEKGAVHLCTLRCSHRFVADRGETQTWWQHETFLRTANGDIDAPFVMAIIDSRKRGDRIDHEQRRMVRSIDRFADLIHMRGSSG